MSLLSEKLKKSAKPKKKKLSEEARRDRALDRSFLRQHRSIFENIGFQRLSGIDGVNFTFKGLKSEIDDIFVFENLIIVAEYTRSNSANLSDHAKGKASIHNKIAECPQEFIAFCKEKFPEFDKYINSVLYTSKQMMLRTLYCSIDALQDHHKVMFSNAKFWSLAERSYFKSLSTSIRRSARYELFEFFGVSPVEVGNSGVISASQSQDRYDALLLPQENSHFPEGFKVVSFYVDPDALLRRAYVLRRNGWRDSDGLYQRLIISQKISSIRRYLKDSRRVFANNIVITLPDSVQIANVSGEPLSMDSVSKTTPVKIVLPDTPSSVGIVDGQHRVYSYFEGDEAEPLIDQMRRQQNLLATGLVYPSKMNSRDREKFEANLFLEINSNQSSASSDVKQAIWTIIDPFRPESVGRVIINRIALKDPLAGYLARTNLDAGKIPTTSIVSYGLLPLLKRSGNDSLFSIWSDPEKNLIEGKERNPDVLERYIQFCVKQISDFLVICKMNLESAKWNILRKDGQGVLSVTTINGILIVMRKLIADGKIDESNLNVSLSKIITFDFVNFKSSQYGKLADALLSHLN
ncbi:hypothetical protein [Novosphingobium sp.]|uniref:hypothetical protein n=1 Tax=Novosphingobium sp. TaxID=1874826 RepID=UPI00260B37E7|nr:hypothetical protein [Novosphingobium sp.]